MNRIVATILVFLLVSMVGSPAFASGQLTIKQPPAKIQQIQPIPTKLLTAQRVDQVRPVVNAFRQGLKNPKTANAALKVIQSELQKNQPIGFVNGYWVVPVDMSPAYNDATIKNTITNKLGKADLNTFNSLLPRSKGAGEVLPENIFLMFVSSTIGPQLGLGPENGYPDYVTDLMPDYGFGPGLLDRGKLNQDFFDHGLPDRGFFDPGFLGDMIADDIFGIGMVGSTPDAGGSGFLGGMDWGDLGEVCGSLIGAWIGALIGGPVGALIGGAIGWAIEQFVDAVVDWLSGDKEKNSNDQNADSDGDGTPNGQDGSPNDEQAEEEEEEEQGQGQGVVDPCWRGCGGDAAAYNWGISFADMDSSSVFTGILAAYFTANQNMMDDDWGWRGEGGLGADYRIIFGF